jgi:site-specific recombinase XerD
MSNTGYVPRPVFDTLQQVIEQYKATYDSDNPQQIIRQWLNACFFNTKVTVPSYGSKDYQQALNFLYSYRGSPDTFNAYRRDLERLLQWSWFVREQSIFKHKRDDIEALIEFCIKPPKRWIGLKTMARFKNADGNRIPNPGWRPFDVKVNKRDHRDGIEAEKSQHQFSQQALKSMFAILGSFYNYLLQDEIIQSNPVALIRQKSKFIRHESTAPAIRRLSEKQWQTVIQVTKEAATKDVKYEREVFILSCLYGMYLRISELTANDRWTPTMGDFFKDSDDNWWFKTVGKGNKARQIAVSPSMLQAIKHYRKTYLNLPPYPALGEKTPLIPHATNPNKPITSKRPIRLLVQHCFDRAADKLEVKGDREEAASLRLATVHWLRHTGISDDVKIRPREHVRDDAGHSSSAITDRYIDVELKERAKSAKKKTISLVS